MTGWWDFAVRAFGALTEPRADIDACDYAVQRLARDSRAGAAVHAVGLVVRRAWASSAFRAAAFALAARLTPASPAAAWRVSGWMVAVTGATALGLNTLAPVPPGPLTWVLPAALVASGLVVMAAAQPLSRAARDLRARRGGGKGLSR